MRKKVFIMLEYTEENLYKKSIANLLKYCRTLGIRASLWEELGEELEIEKEKQFSFKIYGQQFFVKYSEIIFLKKDMRKVILQTTDKSYSFYANMENLLLTLDMDEFVMPHKSYIVNKNKILKVNRFDLHVEGCIERIPVSRRNRKTTIRAI